MRFLVRLRSDAFPHPPPTYPAHHRLPRGWGGGGLAWVSKEIRRVTRRALGSSDMQVRILPHARCAVRFRGMSLAHARWAVTQPGGLIPPASTFHKGEDMPSRKLRGLCHCDAVLLADGMCANRCSKYSDPDWLRLQHSKRLERDAHASREEHWTITVEERKRMHNALLKFDKLYAHAARRGRKAAPNRTAQATGGRRHE